MIIGRRYKQSCKLASIISCKPAILLISLLTVCLAVLHSSWIVSNHESKPASLKAVMLSNNLAIHPSFHMACWQSVLLSYMQA
jgi:hypothetical protein